MKWTLTVIALLLPLHADAVDDASKSLTIAVVLERDESGKLLLDRQKSFSVAFTNGSSEPIRIWSDHCQLGYENLSFDVLDQGQVSRMYLRTPHASNWRNKPNQVITIEPGGTIKRRVGPDDIWGERVWKGVPEPNTDKAVQLAAVFEIPRSDAANKEGLWTGRVKSEPVSALVVDAKLKTPFDYLSNDCPQQALRILKAESKWATRRDSNRQTPLHVAARHGHAEVIRWLLEHGAAVNATAYNNFTPLHFADDPEIVKLLVEHKADVNARDVSGTQLQEVADWCARLDGSPEFAEMRERKLKIAHLLLSAGATYDLRSACLLNDIDRVRELAKDERRAIDRNAMRAAATYGRTAILNVLLHAGNDHTDADYGGLPLSYFAIEHADALQALFDAGADPMVVLNYRGDGRGPQGVTLLHEAAFKGSVQTAKLLLARKVKVDARSAGDVTPLHKACWEGEAAMAKFLLENKADPRARTSDGRTPLSISAAEVRPECEDDNAQHQEIIRALGQAGVDIDVFAAIAINDLPRVTEILRAAPEAVKQCDSDGQPTLHRAVALDRREIVKMLLDADCDPNVRNEKKDADGGHETALLTAAFWGRSELAALLLKRGAKASAKDSNGVTPLHEAARMKQVDVARILLERGADVDARNNEGESPLDYARLYGESREQLEMVDLLKRSAQKK